MKRGKGPSLRPTLTGTLFLGFALVLGLAATVSGSLYLVLVSSFLLVTFGLAALGTWINLLGIEVEVYAPEEVFAAQETRFQVKVRGTGPRFALTIRSPYGGTTLPLLLEREIISLGLVFPKRGRHRLSLHLTSGFPLGLFEAYRPLPPMRLTVYPFPRPARWSEFRLRHLEATDTFALWGEEFREHGPYTGREPSSRIDWKATARHSSPVIRLFEEGGRIPLLDLDKTPGDREILLEKACYLLLKARQAKRPLGLVLGGCLLPPESSIQNLLEALALA